MSPAAAWNRLWSPISSGCCRAAHPAVARNQILQAGRTALVGVDTASTDCFVRNSAVRKAGPGSRAGTS